MKNTTTFTSARWARLMVFGLLALLIAFPLHLAEAQRRGGGGGSFGGGRSFGGGGSSFGGGRSSGGSSFGSGRSSGGSSLGSGRSGSSSFGGGSTSSGRSGGSFGSNRSIGSSSSGGSFGRSGSMGRSSFTSSRSVTYGGRSYVTRPYLYGGTSYHAVYYGGFGDYWYHPAWYFYTPFHPAFYYSRPYYDESVGAYVPGGFSFLNFLFGLLIFGFVIWLISRIFFRSRGLRYTSYS